MLIEDLDSSQGAARQTHDHAGMGDHLRKNCVTRRRAPVDRETCRLWSIFCRLKVSQREPVAGRGLIAARYHEQGRVGRWLTAGQIERSPVNARKISRRHDTDACGNPGAVIQIEDFSHSGLMKPCQGRARRQGENQE